MMAMFTYFEKFFASLNVINNKNTDIKREELTPEQIENEKREFEENKINRKRDDIRSFVARCCEIECLYRDNNKTHNIEKVFINEKTEGTEYHKVIIECSFCGKIDYYYSSNEPEESLRDWLNEEFNK